MLEFRTLGTIDLRGEDGGRVESVLAHAKRASLLAYLCASHPPRLHRRATLVALLWPDADESHARGALRHELSQLRRSLGPGVLLGEGGESVGVNDQQLWCDLQAFLSALADGKPADALDLWRGEFLPGLQVEGGEFERWLDEMRRQLVRRAVDAARTLIATAEEAGDLVAAVGWARRQTQLAPYDETAWQRLLMLLDRNGDRAGALSAYDRLASFLHDELEVEPSPETRRLVEGIREREAAFVVPARSPAVARIAPSSSDREARATGAAGTEAGERLPTRDATPPVERGSVAGARPMLRRRLPYIGLAVPVLAVLVIAFASRTPSGSDRVVIELPSVENQTGDSALEPVRRRLADRLAAALLDAEFVELIATGERGRVDALVSGTLYRQGDGLEVRTRLVQAGAGGRVLAMPPAVSLSPDDPDPGLDTVVARVLSAVATHYDPRFDASGTPEQTLRAGVPSWQAYLEYVRGADLFGHKDFAAAAEHLLASYRLGYEKAAVFGSIALAWSGRPAAADSFASGLLAGADSLNDYDRAFAGWFLANLHGHRPEAYRAAKDYERVGAGASPSAVAVAAMEAMAMNRPGEAVRRFAKVDVDHGWLRNYVDLWVAWAGSYHMLGNHRKELDVVHTGRSRFPESLAMIGAEVRARAALREPEDVRRLLEEALTLPAGDMTPADVAWIAAQELAVHSEESAAATARGIGLDWLARREAPTPAERLLNVRLLLESGDTEGARRLLGTLPPMRDLDWLALTGMVAASCGDAATAGDVVARLEAVDNPYVSGRHLLLASGVQVALNEPAGAVQTLRRALAAGLPFTVELHALPMLRPLSGDPEFRRLLRPRG